MGELQQQCATRSKENRRLAVDAPDHRIRAEYARRPPHRGRPDHHQLALEIGFRDDSVRFRHH